MLITIIELLHQIMQLLIQKLTSFDLYETSYTPFTYMVCLLFTLDHTILILKYYPFGAEFIPASPDYHEPRLWFIIGIDQEMCKTPITMHAENHHIRLAGL